MRNDDVREDLSSHQDGRGAIVGLSDAIRGRNRPPHAAIAPSVRNGKASGEPAAVANSHVAMGIPMSGTEQTGVGLLLFGSLTCMIVGSILAIAARRVRIAAAWATCFAVGCLGVVVVVVVLGKLDADRGRHVRLPGSVDGSSVVVPQIPPETGALATDRFSRR